MSVLTGITFNTAGEIKLTRRLTLVCVGTFLIIGIVLFLPEWFYMLANEIDYPWHFGLFSKLIKIVSISFFIPPIFAVVNRTVRDNNRLFVSVLVVLLTLLIAVFSHLILNEFLQSLAGFRPPNRSLFELVIYTTGRGLEAQFFSFIFPVLIVFGFTRINLNKEEKTAPGSPVFNGFEVKRRGLRTIVRSEEVLYLESDGNYVKLYLEKGGYDLIRNTLGSIEPELAPDFLRIHRSLMVNLKYVTGIHKEKHGSNKVLMTDGQVLNISRSRVAEVNKRISQTLLSGAISNHTK
ncbi:MAG: LytTR family transcriptional regulator [Roseivirga sp.]|nr:LytTR family transcriptional regulator [Roseivirga sp.]